MSESLEDHIAAAHSDVLRNLLIQQKELEDFSHEQHEPEFLALRLALDRWRFEHSTLWSGISRIAAELLPYHEFLCKGNVEGLAEKPHHGIHELQLADQSLSSLVAEYLQRMEEIVGFFPLRNPEPKDKDAVVRHQKQARELGEYLEQFRKQPAKAMENSELVPVELEWFDNCLRAYNELSTDPILLKLIEKANRIFTQSKAFPGSAIPPAYSPLLDRLDRQFSQSSLHAKYARLHQACADLVYVEFPLSQFKERKEKLVGMAEQLARETAKASRDLHTDAYTAYCLGRLSTSLKQARESGNIPAMLKGDYHVLARLDMDRKLQEDLEAMTAAAGKVRSITETYRAFEPYLPKLARRHQELFKVNKALCASIQRKNAEAVELLKQDLHEEEYVIFTSLAKGELDDKATTMAELWKALDQEHREFLKHWVVQRKLHEIDESYDVGRWESANVKFQELLGEFLAAEGKEEYYRSLKKELSVKGEALLQKPHLLMDRKQADGILAYCTQKIEQPDETVHSPLALRQLTPSYASCLRTLEEYKLKLVDMLAAERRLLLDEARASGSRFQESRITDDLTSSLKRMVGVKQTLDQYTTVFRTLLDHQDEKEHYLGNRRNKRKS